MQREDCVKYNRGFRPESEGIVIWSTRSVMISILDDPIIAIINLAIFSLKGLPQQFQ